MKIEALRSHFFSDRQVLLTGSICAVLWAFLTWVSHGLPLPGWNTLRGGEWWGLQELRRMSNGFSYDVPNNDMPTWTFLAVFFITFTLVWRLFARIESKSSTPSALGWVILFSVLFRLILLPGVMIHENDIYRYMWDGKTFLSGINPYQFAPEEVLTYEFMEGPDTDPGEGEIASTGPEYGAAGEQSLNKLLQQRDQNPAYFYRIGHRQVPTIYPPLAQVIFAMSMGVARDSISGMKFVFITFDIGVVLLIARLLSLWGMNPSRCLLYGWSPLVLKEYANAGHYDPVVIFFTLLGVYGCVRGWRCGAIVSLTAATLSKFFAVVLLPVWRHRWRLRHAGIFVALVVAAYLPFMVWDGVGWAGVFAGLGTYNRLWSYNGSLFAVIASLWQVVAPSGSESLLPAKVTAGVMYLTFIFQLSRHRFTQPQTGVHKSFLAMAGLFIVNPVGDPWYYCWSVPFLCFFPYRSWLLLSGLLALSYLNFRSDIGWLAGTWGYIPVLNWLIYVPFFFLLLCERLVPQCFDYTWRRSLMADDNNGTRNKASG